MEYLKINKNKSQNDLTKKLYKTDEKEESQEAQIISKENNNKEIIQKLCIILISILVIFYVNEDIYGQDRFDSKNIAFKKALKFLESNIKGILIQNITFKPIENPKASAIIPVYNSKDYISRAIKSIQNQDLLDLEIILVNDNSTDSSLSVIQEIQKTDSRIKIINNKKNMGILYSRCIGVLSSKAKYIFPLDNDDMFLDKDVFQTITNIADKDNYDIVEFKGIKTLNSNLEMLKNRNDDVPYSDHPLNLVLHQPQLGNFPLLPGKTKNTYDVESGHVWGKCFKTKMYKDGIDILGKERYSRRMIRHEDIFMIYILCNTANSYKFVGKYGILNVNRKGSASRIKTKSDDEINSEMDSYHIYILEIAVEIVKNTVDNKKILYNFVMYLLYSKTLKITLKNDTFKKIFFDSVNKVLKMDKISDELKNDIRKKGNELNLSFL